MSYQDSPCIGCGTRMVGQKHPGSVPEGFKRHISKGKCTTCYEQDRRAAKDAGTDDHVAVDIGSTVRPTPEENRAALETWLSTRRNANQLERIRQVRIQQEQARARFIQSRR